MCIIAIINVVDICKVDGLSMYPTLDNGDVLLLLKTHRVDYGDIVVVQNDGSLLVKRVIACGGDNVSVNGEKVYLNNSIIREAYAYYDDSTNSLSDVSCEVPNNYTFVMGDNRKESFDSRKIGPVANRDVVGKVFLNVTALCGLNEKQFQLTLRIISIVSILLLGLSILSKSNKKAIQRQVIMANARCNEYVAIGGDENAHVSGVVEYDREGKGVFTSGGEDAVRNQSIPTEFSGNS